MATALLMFPSVLAVAVGVAPLAVIPPPKKPRVLPFSAVTPKWADARAVDTVLPTGSSTAQGVPNLRGQATNVPAGYRWKDGEDLLLDILSDTSVTKAAMYYESDVLRLPRVATGGPSLRALLDLLEASRPPSSTFTKASLVGDWHLEFTTDLDKTLREEVAQYDDGEVIDLSVTMSITEDLSTSTTAVISLLNGQKKVVSLQSSVVQEELSSSFFVAAQNNDHFLMEVAYATDDVLIRKEFEQADEHLNEVLKSSGGLSRALGKDVWRKVKNPSEPRPLTGRTSLWRFGLSMHSVTEVTSRVSMGKADAANPVRTSLGALILAACLAAAGGRRWGRRTVPNDAAVTEMTAPKFAVAFIGGQLAGESAESENAGGGARSSSALEREDSPRRGHKTVRSAKSSFNSVDASYNPTWLDIQEQPIGRLEWSHPQTIWAGLATAFYVFDLARIVCKVPPTDVEAVLMAFIYFGLYASRYQDVPKLEPHYQVSFYASCGWTFYAWVSLVHGMAYGPSPLLPIALAEPLHASASIIFLASCIYFYTYHWGRQIRHAIEGRFRPWFAAGLASLTVVHGLTVGHVLKMLDDPGWWKTIAHIYDDEWRWLADTRLLELYLTAAALFLVILHLRGVLTGTKNAAVVFLGTVILPTAALFFETHAMKACAWEHYFMVGPKYF